MSGHSQFKNIMHRKGAQDAKKAKLFTKLLREVTVAAKFGQDPGSNPRLRAAITAAKNANMSKDKVASAISKASNLSEAANLEEVRYEGYAPGGLALIVEAVTDNRNRTASEVRSAFTKFGGNLGEMGSVSFLFKKVGSIVYPSEKTSYGIMLDATIEAGGDDCINLESHYEIICSVDSYDDVRNFLEKKFGSSESTGITWKPITLQKLSVVDGEKILKLLEALEECDDVQNVIGDFEIPNECFKS